MPLSRRRAAGRGARRAPSSPWRALAAPGRRADIAVGLEGGIDLRRTMPSAARLPHVVGVRHRRPARRPRLRRRHRGALGAPGRDRGPTGIELSEAIDAFAARERRAQQPGGVGVLTSGPLRPHALLRDRAHQRLRALLSTPASIGEPLLPRPGSGWIEVITGSMFSGKSEELIRRVRRAADRAPARADLQAEGGRPLRHRPHREPLRHEDAVAGGGVRAGDPRAASRTAPRSWASTRGSSSTPAWCRS